MSISRLLAGVLVLLSAGTALALPRFEAIDMGVPTDGTRVMHGYRGYVIRAVSDLGPIQRVRLGDFNGISDRIQGGLAQRWTVDGTGNFVTSPGPIAANNTTPTDFNFDSHFVFNPDYVTIDLLDVDLASGPRIAALDERAFEPLGFIENGDPRFPPNFMPIPSTPSIHYGVAFFSFNEPEYGLLRGNFTIKPEFRATTFDVAYVVSNSTFSLGGGFAPKARRPSTTPG